MCNDNNKEWYLFMIFSTKFKCKKKMWFKKIALKNPRQIWQKQEHFDRKELIFFVLLKNDFPKKICLNLFKKIYP